MRDRCNIQSNKDWHRYGGRGIKVCERWNSFANFVADVGEPPFPGAQLDRINNDGDYEPGNVRWATRYEQQVNSRNIIVWVEVDGVRLSFKLWARKLGVSPQILRYRAKILGSRELAIRSITELPVNPRNRPRLKVYHASII